MYNRQLPQKAMGPIKVMCLFLNYKGNADLVFRVFSKVSLTIVIPSVRKKEVSQDLNQKDIFHTVRYQSTKAKVFQVEMKSENVSSYLLVI